MHLHSEIYINIPSSHKSSPQLAIQMPVEPICHILHDSEPNIRVIGLVSKTYSVTACATEHIYLIPSLPEAPLPDPTDDN